VSDPCKVLTLQAMIVCKAYLSSDNGENKSEKERYQEYIANNLDRLDHAYHHMAKTCQKKHESGEKIDNELTNWLHGDRTINILTRSALNGSQGTQNAQDSKYSNNSQGRSLRHQGGKGLTPPHIPRPPDEHSATVNEHRVQDRK